MSNSLLPKQVPPLLRQENLDKAKEILRQPMSIAVLASVGVHGLLWTALPLMSFRSNDLNTKQTVKLVELSPAERSKLPALSNPPTSLPQGTSLFKSAPKAEQPLGKPPSVANPLDDSSLYKFPTIQPPPPDVWSSLTMPPIFPVNPPPAPGNPTNKTTTGRKPPTPEVSPSPSPSPSPPDAKGGNPSDTKGGSNAQTPSPDVPARSGKLSDKQIAAFRQEWETMRQQQQQFAFNSANTTVGDFNNNATSFTEMARTVSKGEIERDHTQKRVDGIYPKDACPLSIKGRAAFGALVSPDGKLVAMTPDGKLVNEPVLLMSSGRKPLDEMAADYVKQFKFTPSKSGLFRTVLFDFTFEPPADCPSGGAKPGNQTKPVS